MSACHRYLYTGGIVLMRIGAWLDEKAKKLECVVQQIGFSNGIVEMEKSDRKKHNGSIIGNITRLALLLDYAISLQARICLICITNWIYMW